MSINPENWCFNISEHRYHDNLERNKMIQSVEARIENFNFIINYIEARNILDYDETYKNVKAKLFVLQEFVKILRNLKGYLDTLEPTENNNINLNDVD